MPPQHSLGPHTPYTPYTPYTPHTSQSSDSKMTFWQENYSFIREVYDTRYCKMVEWMDNVEMAIQKVCASKVYTSAEFKREKDNFHVIFY